MQNRFAKWLKILTIVLGALMLVVCVIFVPFVASSVAADNPGYAGWRIPVIAFVYLTAVPFYAALYQMFRLCNLILLHESFSLQSAALLKRTGICALCEVLLYLAGGVVLACCGVLHPILLMVILVIQAAGAVVALICGILASLFESAVKMKEENELTV